MRLKADDAAAGKVSADGTQKAFAVTPRKGQFVVFRPKTGNAGSCSPLKNAPSVIIEPVPTTRTKGVILWQTVYGHVVVGPTATDQVSKTDRTTDMDTVEKLVTHAYKVMPSLKDQWDIVGTYSGLRPSTQYR